MEIVIKHNAQKNRFEGFVDGKMVSRSRHESYVRDQLAKLGFVVGTVKNDVSEKASEFGINERFSFVEQMVSMCAKKTIASVIITGQGGLGKTHTVLKALKTNGMADTTDLAAFELGARINTPKSFKVIKGFSTAKGLYRTLFEGNGQTLVFDDCDSVLTDPTALNLLKGALDSYGDRWVSWNVRYSPVVPYLIFWPTSQGFGTLRPFLSYSPGPTDDVFLSRCVFKSRMTRKSLSVHHLQRRLGDHDRGHRGDGQLHL